MMHYVQVLQESLRIPGTGIYLVYHSSQTPGYMSTILIQLTPSTIPANLSVIHVRILVEGLVYERVFEADPNLKYNFAWDRRNAYNQKVYGIVTASGKSVQRIGQCLVKLCYFYFIVSEHVKNNIISLLGILLHHIRFALHCVQHITDFLDISWHC